MFWVFWTYKSYYGDDLSSENREALVDILVVLGVLVVLFAAAMVLCMWLVHRRDKQEQEKQGERSERSGLLSA